MSVTVMGLSVTRYPQSANPDFKRVDIDVLYTHQNQSSAKIERVAIGRTSKEPFGKDPLKVNAEYAELVINSGALVSGQEYDFGFTFNDNEMATEITEFIPEDPKVKQHFESCIRDYQNRNKPRSEQIKDFENKAK